MFRNPSVAQTLEHELGDLTLGVRQRRGQLWRLDRKRKYRQFLADRND